MRLQVRCCCIPKKLLGTVQVPDDTTAGDEIRFTVFKDEMERVSVEPISEHARVEDVKLTAAYIYDHATLKNDRWLALKSNDYPIETLKKIPGFIPNDG